MARKKKGSEDFLKKITALESVFGQKETAKRLGVSPATLRNYKTGKTTPPSDKAKKVNRVYGQNKKKVTEEKLERYEKKVAKKKEARAEYLKKNPKLIATGTWVRQAFDEEYIRVAIQSDAPPYVAPIGDRGQFTDGFTPIGIPKKGKGRTVVQLYGLYITQFMSGGVWVNLNHADDEKTQEQADFDKSPFPVMLAKEMDLEKALDYLESSFFKTGKVTGRRRRQPYKFIGFEL